ncbi:hypothetical protein GIB67_039098 [Kingdonia uniflora]|uniref:Uncharacterized protein n=1 Tax=Kingdonia uniflora TaxID=39325 RepID=A0A7J7LKX3_9MAGN|nr:hypothetical protein GIB67_039098 [Kingdonia uniflora]
MLKTRSQRVVEARVLNDLRLAFKIDEIREAIFRQQGYDTWSVEDRKKFVLMMAREEIINEDMDVAVGLLKACGIVGNTVIYVCETLNGRWAASGNEKRISAKDFLEYYAVKYVTATNGAHLCSSSARPCFFYLPSAGRVWNDNLLWVSGECLQRSDKEPLELNNRTITKDVVAKEGTELEAVLKELEISSMEEKLATSELNIPMKLARLNEIPDGPVDMATVSSTVVQNLAKRKAVKWGAAPYFVSSVSVDDNSKGRKVISPTKSQEMLEESDKITEGADLRPRFEVEADLLKEQCRAKAREKMVAVMDDEFKKVDGARKKDLPARGGEKPAGREADSGEGRFLVEREKEKEAVALKLKQVRAESEAEVERLVTASAISQNNLAGKLYYLRYTKAEITTFSEGSYEEMEIMDEEEVEEREGGLNTTEKTDADNQETINQEIEISSLRVVDLEGLLEVEKESSAELQKELDTARVREEQTLLYNAEYVEEYEALISQYEDRLDDNVKPSLKLEEAKRQISDMKCNIRALNELVLKREIDLDIARTNFVVSEADFKKLSISIVGKDRELHNSEQICDSLIAWLDRLKANLRCLKGKEAQSRADLVEIQAKNQNLVDDLSHARRNVRRATQREKEMNKRINQLCERISKSEWELSVRELKYQKDLKFELDKKDCEIAFGEGSQEMKEFLYRE